MALTREQIVSAANELRNRGQVPSVRTLREVLGTGSLGTISRLWREVSASLPRPSGTDEEIPDDLLRLLREAFANQARKIRSEAEATSAAFRDQIEALEKETLTLESRLAEETKKAALREEALQRGEGRIAEIRASCEVLSRALEQERSERLRAEKQASTHEGERQALLAHLQDLKEQLAFATERREAWLLKNAAPAPASAAGKEEESGTQDRRGPKQET